MVTMTTTPEIWDRLFLAAKHSVPNPGLLSNPLLYLTQVPIILNTFANSVWIDLYPKDLSHFQEPGIEKSFSKYQSDTKLMSVSKSSLPSLQKLPPMDLDSHPTWDCSLWLLSGALVMGLNTNFPPFPRPTSHWRPLRAAIPVLHWMVSWWMVPPGLEPDFVILAPLYHSVRMFGLQWAGRVGWGLGQWELLGVHGCLGWLKEIDY
ncbi:hypothetical protein DSO57_1010975 [Entomophthora muscae]|uniref:Uncharacterized protein n=1 Tax=Entomophthora muscae TaxID=34485 RepID=A0ACC2UG70_9FUNG|nr:hypothetical protein DSO57_1010975 [Entomophthora muscae]